MQIGGAEHALMYNGALSTKMFSVGMNAPVHINTLAELVAARPQLKSDLREWFLNLFVSNVVPYYGDAELRQPALAHFRIAGDDHDDGVLDLTQIVFHTHTTYMTIHDGKKMWPFDNASSKFRTSIDVDALMRVQFHHENTQDEIGACGLIAVKSALLQPLYVSTTKTFAAEIGFSKHLVTDDILAHTFGYESYSEAKCVGMTLKRLQAFAYHWSVPLIVVTGNNMVGLTGISYHPVYDDKPSDIPAPLSHSFTRVVKSQTHNRPRRDWNTLGKRYYTHSLSDDPHKWCDGDRDTRIAQEDISHELARDKRFPYIVVQATDNHISIYTGDIRSHFMDRFLNLKRLEIERGVIKPKRDFLSPQQLCDLNGRVSKPKNIRKQPRTEAELQDGEKKSEDDSGSESESESGSESESESGSETESDSGSESESDSGSDTESDSEGSGDDTGMDFEYTDVSEDTCPEPFYTDNKSVRFINIFPQQFCAIRQKYGTERRVIIYYRDDRKDVDSEHRESHDVFEKTHYADNRADFLQPDDEAFGDLTPILDQIIRTYGKVPKCINTDFDIKYDRRKFDTNEFEIGRLATCRITSIILDPQFHLYWNQGIEVAMKVMRMIEKHPENNPHTHAIMQKWLNSSVDGLEKSVLNDATSLALDRYAHHRIRAFREDFLDENPQLERVELTAIDRGRAYPTTIYQLAEEGYRWPRFYGNEVFQEVGKDIQRDALFAVGRNGTLRAKTGYYIVCMQDAFGGERTESRAMYFPFLGGVPLVTHYGLDKLVEWYGDHPIKIKYALLSTGQIDFRHITRFLDNDVLPALQGSTTEDVLKNVLCGITGSLGIMSTTRVVKEQVFANLDEAKIVQREWEDENKLLTQIISRKINNDNEHILDYWQVIGYTYNDVRETHRPCYDMIIEGANIQLYEMCAKVLGVPPNHHRNILKCIASINTDEVWLPSRLLKREVIHEMESARTPFDTPAWKFSANKVVKTFKRRREWSYFKAGEEHRQNIFRFTDATRLVNTLTRVTSWNDWHYAIPHRELWKNTHHAQRPNG